MPETPRSHSDAIIDSELIALFVVEDGRLVDANALLHRALGHAPGALVGKSVREMLAGTTDPAAIVDGIRQALRDGRQFTGTLRQPRRDGSVGWYEVRVGPLPGDPGKLIGALIDRTLDHERIQRLQADEARYRSVVEDQTEVIARFAPDGTVHFVNEVYCRLFGVSAAAIVGRSWRPLAHADDVAMVEARLQEMSPVNPVVVVENRVYTAGGQLRWMQFANRGLYDAGGNLREIQAVGRDITSLKETEAKLRQSDERLVLALEGSGLVIWDWNIADGTVESGHRLSDLLGYTPEELGQRQEDWMDLIHPDDRPRFDERMSAHLRGETANFESEHRLRHRDGHWVSVEGKGKVSVRDSENHPVRMVGTLLDVTQRKRLHEEGVQLLKRIESLIRDAAPRPPVVEPGGKPLDLLTKRERQILGLIAAGMTSAQIAAQLSVATPTVVSHRRNLMAKLDLHGAAEVTRFALENGLLPAR